MAVRKKTSADAKALADKETKTKEEKPIEVKPDEVKTEPVVVSDVITETIEIAEVPVSQTTTQEAPSNDPLSDFKEKLNREEFSMSGESTPKKSYMWPILFIFIIAVVLLGGIFAYKQGVFKAIKINVPVATPTPTATPTPEPTATPDLTKFEIEILNGSGVTGEASAQKLNLTAAGFTISSVGNADNSDYTDTIIKAKTEVDKSFVAKLKSTLESSFTSVIGQTLDDTSSVPVIVILGTKK